MNTELKKELDKAIETFGLIGSSTRNENKKVLNKMNVNKSERAFMEWALIMCYKQLNHINKYMNHCEEGQLNEAVQQSLSHFRSVISEKGEANEKSRVIRIKCVIAYVSSFLKDNMRKGVSVI